MTASSIRFYFEDARRQLPAEPTTVPLGLAEFANDFKSIRRFAERDHKNIVEWHTYEVGGHYAAHQVPEVYAKDVRNFFNRLIEERRSRNLISSQASKVG